MQNAIERYHRLHNFFSSKTPLDNLLFPDFKSLDFNDVTDEKKITYINQMALGGIVVLLSYRQQQNKDIHPLNHLGERELHSPYLSHFTTNFRDIVMSVRPDRIEPDTIKVSISGTEIHHYVPHYTLTWDRLCNMITGLGSNISNKHIEEIGNLVLQGRLPFDFIILTDAFPEVAEDLKILAGLTDQNSDYAKYYQIKSIFLQAKKVSETNTTPDGDRFRLSLDLLRRETLQNYSRRITNYTLDGCTQLANSILKVSNKVGEMNVTQEDVNTFIRETKAYKQYDWDSIGHTLFQSFYKGLLFGILLGNFLGIILVLIVPTLINYVAIFLPIATFGCGVISFIAGLADIIWNHSIDSMEASLAQMSKHGIDETNGYSTFPSFR